MIYSALLQNNNCNRKNIDIYRYLDLFIYIYIYIYLLFCSKPMIFNDLFCSTLQQNFYVLRN